MTPRPQISIDAPGHAERLFSIAVEPQRDTVLIAPSGELDLATVEQLQRELERRIDAGFARIVIDLRGLEFMDSTGLHVLITAHAQAQRDNWKLTIIPGPRQVQHIFEMTGTIDRLPFATTKRRTANALPGDSTSPITERSATSRQASR